MDAIDILIKYWGHTNFRLKQENIINDIISGRDTLALLPTGAGKSICYQVPTLLNDGICVVISPLISLMGDQIRHLRSKGIKSVSITSNMHYSEIDTALTNCIYGGVKFLYISPERLQNELLQNRMKEMNITLITVDEAHCISEWGHNFRPAYRNISEIRSIIPNTPILALTATATLEVIKDIQKNLLFNKQNVIRSSFKRDKLSYVVDNVEDKKKRLVKLLTKIKSSVIVYTGSRKTTQEISNFLISNNFSSTFYHAGLSVDIRNKRQENWTRNQIRIMVATNAFGMGINKSDVKLVVHMELPKTIEAYFQQAGRAGRDGQTSYAFLLANQYDIIKQENLLKLRYPDIVTIKECYQNIANFLHIAVNQLPEEPLVFDITTFSSKYKYSILKTYNILKYLEKEEYIKLIDTAHTPSKLMITITNSELYKFQIANNYFDPFIKLLLRSYSNLFNHFVVINEKKIAKEFNKPIEEVKKILNKLKQLEIVKYQSQTSLPLITLLQSRKDISNLFLNETRWIERKEHEKKKLSKISEYISSKNTCRSQILLKYFGEEKSKKCGICDICVIENRETIKGEMFRKVSLKIQNIITENELSLEEICLILSDIDNKAVINILNILFDNDKIIKFGNKYQWKE